MRRRLLPVLGLTTATAAGCAGPPPPPPQIPAVVEVAKPAPTRARWVFPAGQRTVKALVDLGGDTRLYVGVDGLRAIAKAGAAPVEARTVALDDFLGVLRDDKGQLVFVGGNGDVFTAAEPLGELSPARPGPLHRDAPRCDPNEGGDCLNDRLGRFAWLTTGRASIFGAKHDGTLLRSADYGASWKPALYAGDRRPFGRPGSFELDAHGNGLLLHYPQRLFVTHDDGATWTPMPSPGIGAREIRRDGDDRLWLIGPRERARLEGDKLVVTTALPRPLAPPFTEAPGDDRPREAERTLLCGDRSVHLAVAVNETSAVLVGSAPLGEKPAKPSEHPPLNGEGQTRLVACNGADMIFLRANEYDGNVSRRTSAVFRSKDWGATWTEDGTVFGIGPQESNGVDVALGPDGWTFVTSLCPGADDENECPRRQIRPAKGAAFEDLAFTDEFDPRMFAFDREHDRVYAAGAHNGGTYLYQSPLTGNHFARVRMLEAAGASRLAITVDAAGTVRIMMYDTNKHAWTLDRIPLTGEALPTLYVPLAEGPIAFAGLHGLLFSERGDGWETADAGDTWMSTTRVATSSLSCTEAGCLDEDGAERVGWDLPAWSGGEVVHAAPEPPAPPERESHAVDLSPPPAPEVAQQDLTCKPAGAVTTLAGFPGSDLVDSRGGEVRWATVKREADGKTSVVFGTKSGVRDAQLLPAAAKPAKRVTGKPTTTVTSGDRVLDFGVVAARYRVTTDPSGQRQPIDVELSWWSSVTGKTHHHELKKVPVFYVPSYTTFSGTPQIVDGGLLFQPAGGREVYFVRDDDKVETFSVPSGTSVQTAERLGKSWILMDSSGGNASIHWSGEGGKGWTRRDWALESSGRAVMALLGGKPMVAYAPGPRPTALFALGTAPSADPPLPVVVHGGGEDAACSEAATLRDVAYVPTGQRRLRARVELAKNEPQPAGRLSISNRVTHVTAEGGLCTSASILSGIDPRTNDSQTAFLYPEPKGATGWWFRRVVDPKDKSKKVVLASPLTCEKGAPEARR